MGGYWNDIVETKIVCATAPLVLQESRGQETTPVSHKLRCHYSYLAVLTVCATLLS